MVATCQAGYEAALAGELAAAGRQPAARGPGWVQCQTDPDIEPPELAFAPLILLAPRALQAGAVNALAQQAVDFFAESLRDEHIAAAWPNLWIGSTEIAGLTRRISATRRAFDELLRRKLARVARLASPGVPPGIGPVRGLFVFFTDFDRAWVSRTAVLGGQRRMADDPAAPSRSYLKIEEAYGVLGAEPRPDETVIDLGAAPGGWSFSAARRGAQVLAVDNGLLKGGALGHPRIEHRREDAASTGCFATWWRSPITCCATWRSHGSGGAGAAGLSSISNSAARTRWRCCRSSGPRIPRSRDTPRAVASAIFITIARSSRWWGASNLNSTIFWRDFSATEGIADYADDLRAAAAANPKPFYRRQERKTRFCRRREETCSRGR